MDTFINKLLNHFQLTQEEYDFLTRKISVDDLPRPEDYHNIENFIARINEAIANNQQILIYGDYDADGIMATAILKYTFSKLGKSVHTMIPSRYKDGYGITPQVIERISKRHIDLIITVDNGIVAHKAIDKARELAIDVLVSDHHTIGETLPNAVAVIHPDLSKLSPLNSCGAFMALIISRALLEMYDPYLVTLAGIATVADMMELKNQNRVVVKLATTFATSNRYYALDKLNLSTFYDENSFAMRIGPKINALGRLSQNYEANILVEYFTTESQSRINEIALYIEEVYAARRQMSSEIVIDEKDVLLPATVIISEELEGVLGIIAQNQLMKYNKPAVVFTKSSEDPKYLKGSGRSKEGFSLVEAFAKLDHLIVTWGGHVEAAGIKILADNFVEFKKQFNLLAKDASFSEKIYDCIDIDYNELTIDNANTVLALSPFGNGFEAPLFKIENVAPSKLKLSKDQKHILSKINDTIKVVGFNKAENLKNKENLTLIGAFTKSEYRNIISVDFKLNEVI